MDEQRQRRSVNATVLGLVVNALLAAAKTAAGVVGHSQALIADGIESFADIVSSLLVWRGVVVAAAPADAEHPYGHGKAEPLAAIGVTMMLIGAAFWISIQSVQQILVPHETPAPWTLAVLVVVIVAKEALFRFVRNEALALENTAVHTDAWHHRSDAITSLAALIGIAVAVVGGRGYEAADDFAALIAAAIIAWNGLRMVGPALNELMDASPDLSLTERVRAEAGATPGVEGIEKCLIRKMGGRYFVDMHVEVDPQMTVDRAHIIAHEVKDRVRERLPQIQDVLVHIEPAGHATRRAQA
ncbi:MAG TPA: cation diffusion facilitator family transporter [Verrucomicrobiae bacterium]|nr:cation diffusion facilitator family transporter [Verrucomicrobiae bacterium]